jgi:hypothetical protein
MAESDADSHLTLLARDAIAAAAYDRLVVSGSSTGGAKKLLGAVRPQQLLSVSVKSQDAASAMLAGLWLWHDALDESHTISQSLHTPTGSFWHAIMHRREGDFWNSKYWYARCRNHPALNTIAAQAGPLLAKLTEKPTLGRLARGGWDSDAYVDWVEELSAGTDASSREIAVKLQQLEWQALFQYCARQAAGS